MSGGHFNFDPRQPDQGYDLYFWDSGLSAPVICWIHAEAGSSGGPDEPPEPEVVELHHAWLGNVDLMPILSEDQCSEIEDGYVEEMKRLSDLALIDAWEASHDYDEHCY